jgi:hypothetical protein
MKTRRLLERGIGRETLNLPATWREVEGVALDQAAVRVADDDLFADEWVPVVHGEEVSGSQPALAALRMGKNLRCDERRRTP